MFLRSTAVLFLIFSLLYGSVLGAPDDTLAKSPKARKILFAGGCAAAATGSLIYLNQAWYKPYSSGKFHTFNDNSEWLQMDKAGHAYSNFTIGRLMMQSAEWAGFSASQSELFGYSGLAYMTAVEVMDGFSSGYGFSWGDMSANVAGTLLAVGQHHFWQQPRVLVKFSFHQTSFPQYRPALLGSDLSEQVLKDYNGQTYWLSVNPSSFCKKETWLPRWLNIAIGYGATGMISGQNNWVLVQSNGTVVGNDRYRRVYFSLDADLTRIKTRSRFLRAVFSAFNCIKIPFPALELSNSKLQAHWLYF